ncbi:hypothetical protein ALI22I_43400 [Saccharothrix sp. ALI-22-I]|uniref:hypothetical protein n=1 Tax=Saccharothrix sp. ALI-22-I TaxID=1933778 RepID=UPI00097C8AEC|nr:hypothetical protein [Saccharothrix sp. ALI-22-I]ONI80232.1 hypothetical protein ALI22I_43400 [Saccharothrix sp. ALI-22-I]
MSVSPFLQKYFAKRLRSSVVSLLLWAVLAGFTVYLGSSVVGTLTGDRAEVTATAVEETTTSQTTGSRRNRSIDQVRALRIEFEHDGQQRRETVVADQHDVGDTFPVYVDGEAVALEKPSVATMTWVLLAVLLIAAVVWAWIAIAGLIRTSRLRGFDPESAAERFALTVQQISPRKSNKTIFLRVTGVVSGSNAANDQFAAGRVVTLESYDNTMPPANAFPAQLEARLLPGGGVLTTALVHTLGASDWWVATVSVDNIHPAPRANSS